MSTQCYGVVRNIPSAFRSSDLKNFFSDLVENAKFKCFHYKHRPESLRTKSADTSEGTSTVEIGVHKISTCCCVFQTMDEETLDEVISKYNNANWISRSGSYMKERCVVHRIKIDCQKTEKPSSVATGFSTRRETKYRKHHAESEEFSRADLLALSELQPPTHVMPRGNVGTTTKEFMQLIRECKLPPRVIRKLDLKFPLNGSTRRYGNVHMTYTDTRAKTAPGLNTFTANGDIVENNSKILPAQKLEDVAVPEPKLESKDEKNEVTEDSGTDDDTGEEWERHEALHNDVTSQERTKERLFEENIELKWEKGGSGLVFYTDAQFWNEQEGDFEEQNTDDWDIDMSEYYGGKGDLDARQYLEIRRERMRGKAIYDESLSDLKMWKRKKEMSRSESPPAKNARGRFEKYTKGVGRRLMEKDGWKDGDPLGPQQREGAITDPIELDGQNPNIKRGLGYHGDKIVRPSTSLDFTIPSTSHAPKYDKFWGPRSSEPLASHSPHFPQFAFNLPNNTFRERTKMSRSRATPGPDDGIVITTAYDNPLDIDSQDEYLRSKHPTALKHRRRPTDMSRPTQSTTDNFEKDSKCDKRVLEHLTPLHLSSVKFIKGGVLDAKR